MIPRALIVPLVFVLLTSCGQSPETTPPVKNDTKPKPEKIDSSRTGLMYVPEFSVVRKSAYETYSSRIGDSVYNCDYKGHFESSDTVKGIGHFLFDLQVEFLIDKLYFFPVEQNRFFVCWQETDHLGVYTYFGLYERDNNSPVWQKQYRAPSPGQPVIDSDAVYVSTLGMIGKFDLHTGDPVWVHDSLFDPIRLSYKQFERPLLYTNTACFYDLPIKGKKNRRDSIWVNEASGKIRR